MKAPLASLRDPGRLRWWCHALTHTRIHTALLSRVGAVHCFVSYFTGHKPTLVYTEYRTSDATAQQSDCHHIRVT